METLTSVCSKAAWIPFHRCHILTVNMLRNHVSNMNQNQACAIEHSAQEPAATVFGSAVQHARLAEHHSRVCNHTQVLPIRHWTAACNLTSLNITKVGQIPKISALPSCRLMQGAYEVRLTPQLVDLTTIQRRTVLSMACMLCRISKSPAANTA